MKKQMLVGVALGISLSLSSAVYANSVRADTALQNPEQPGIQLETSAPAQPNRLAGEASHDVGARWSWVDRNGKTEIMAFTSTAAAQNAATLMNRSGESLSFANFGRVPFYQMLTVNNLVTPSSSTPSAPRPMASLPEPTTLTLLGAGLAALAAGIRRKNKKLE